MTGYPVLCTTCGANAVYKIASHWSDGITSELKTYSLSCAKCLKQNYRDACGRQAACPLALDETLAKPGIFERGPTLTPRPDLES